MSRWNVRQTPNGSWAVRETGREPIAYYPSHMWTFAYDCAHREAVMDGLGIIGIGYHT